MSNTYNRKCLPELRQICEDRGLETTGRKSAVIQRLIDADSFFTAGVTVDSDDDEIVFNNVQARPDDDGGEVEGKVNDE